jgi:hypothetical protein
MLAELRAVEIQARLSRQFEVLSIAITDNEIRVWFHRRAHLPIVLASGLFNKPVPVPWWNDRALRLIQ